MGWEWKGERVLQGGYYMPGITVALSRQSQHCPKALQATKVAYKRTGGGGGGEFETRVPNTPHPTPNHPPPTHTHTHPTYTSPAPVPPRLLSRPL